MKAQGNALGGPEKQQCPALKGLNIAFNLMSWITFLASD